MTNAAGSKFYTCTIKRMRAPLDAMSIFSRGEDFLFITERTKSLLTAGGPLKKISTQGHQEMAVRGLFQSNNTVGANLAVNHFIFRPKSTTAPKALRDRIEIKIGWSGTSCT